MSSQRRRNLVQAVVFFCFTTLLSFSYQNCSVSQQAQTSKTSANSSDNTNTADNSGNTPDDSTGGMNDGDEDAGAGDPFATPPPPDDVVVDPDPDDETPTPTPTPVVTTPDCSAAKIADLLAPAAEGSRVIRIDCNVRLTEPRSISKSILLSGDSASGVVIDLADSTLGSKDAPVFIRVESILKFNATNTDIVEAKVPIGIKLKNFRFFGRMSLGTQSSDKGSPLYKVFYRWSREPGYARRAQAIAPSDISISRVSFRLLNTNAIYVNAGVRGLTVVNSRFTGTSEGTAIYLAHESAHHVFKNNFFNVSAGREIIAVDGSAFNEFDGNEFHNTSRGAIHLYRNCGEKGITRQLTPKYNLITNNKFYYNGYWAIVALGSRQGNRDYCDEDNDSQYGSGVNNHDFARRNTVTNNILYGPSSLRTDDSFVVGTKGIFDNDFNNTVSGNRFIELN